MLRENKSSKAKLGLFANITTIKVEISIFIISNMQNISKITLVE